MEGGRDATIPLAEGGAGAGAGAGAGWGVLEATTAVVRRAVRRATPATLPGVTGAPTIASATGAYVAVSTPVASVAAAKSPILRERVMVCAPRFRVSFAGYPWSA